MNITIYRNTCNRLYTEGSLAVNDRKITRTVEATEVMLPTGTYEVKLLRINSPRRKIAIVPSTFEGKRGSLWTIGLAHSWIGSRKHKCICIGQQLIPGVRYKGTATYERLYDRIEKCLYRKERITLKITERTCVGNNPTKHWTTAY